MTNNGLTGFELAIKGALDDLGVGLLSRPREFVGLVSDLYDPDSPEVTVLYLHAADGLLRPYAEAALARDADALATAAGRAELWLRDARFVDAGVAHAVAWGIERGTSAHLGIVRPGGVEDARAKRAVDGARAVLADAASTEQEVTAALESLRALPAGSQGIGSLVAALERKLGQLVEERLEREEAARKAEEQRRVAEEAARRQREEQERLQRQREAELKAAQRRAYRLGAIVVFVVVCVAAAACVLALNWNGNNAIVESAPLPPSVSIPDMSDFEPKAGIGEYSWPELKAISNEIASAQSDDEGLEIAQQYNLMDPDGRLVGDTKAITLADDTEAQVRILGFRHDELENGDKAGITFEFADVPTEHRMNAENTNEGGWEASEMRTWLNSDFLEQLPDDLRGCVEPTVKYTNNVGHVEHAGDITAVTATTDSLWLLSIAEVYGEVPREWYSPTIYDEEGSQYQLYADNGLTMVDYTFSTKTGVDSEWWLRSTHANFKSYFRCVASYGDGYHMAKSSVGVSPAFCF